ncbi:MAG: ATP synthase F1 subunit epsilon [Planctomycetota bacterium]|jgi:F-type H+-transporting ATPase subunit epsilon|nr:ATP synthase F1 subunit epsilon [Planctomycetota bacterium]MDP6520857.1 ATP synthase F1 subunit epsilon [Planctomycetota bacterium]MDP6838947.1 ATP synthase F1 subunit epsilon [Planctomycetota bacterium]MDP6955380.1 ATP synthase F1 subunit epsilon [Planctomycetota bacterium]
MPGQITLRIITPEAVVLDRTVSSVKFMALDGSMGVLPGHAPMVTALGPGELVADGEGQSEHYFVSGGFAEVAGGTLRVVSDACERPSDIDVERAGQAAERARTRLKERRVGDAETFDLLRAEASLRRALMRQNLAGRRRT